jgi:quinol monooxygenase YgiN
MYVVCVTFEIKPDQMGAFLPLMLAQAKTSLEVESACHVFDVCLSENDENTVFLYEVYADQAAFQAHLTSAHFITFDATVSDMVKEKSVATFHRAPL